MSHSYDPASLHIIDRLEQLRDRMEEGFKELSSKTSDTFTTMHENTQRLPEAHYIALTPKIPIVEGILEWDIFDNLGFEIKGRSLALVHDLEPDIAYPSPCAVTLPGAKLDVSESYSGSSLAESDIKVAIQSFLENVHPKNPIVEPKPLQDAASHCQLNGFGMDGFSALVAIACALGFLASPYTALPADFQEQQARGECISNTRVANAFFNKARTIVSVLPSSLLTIQCLFFCGVYEMYSIRPVAAWLNFSQASLQLKIQLLSSRPFAREEFDSPKGRLIQRLYWSCMQSELELANELRLSSSGLENLQFPSAFPSPPVELTNEETMRSWMYYLSETSLRRICDEVARTIYKQAPTEWTKDLTLMQADAERLEEKAKAWMANLPETLLVGSRPPESTNELGLHIRSRYLQCRSWIFRPFLYIMVHATQATLAEHRKNIEPLAYACLESCMDCINDVTFHHRHHGTWYMVRGAFASALLLLAGAKTGYVPMPPNWRNAIRRTLLIVNRWNADCEDLKVSAKILDNLGRQVA